MNALLSVAIVSLAASTCLAAVTITGPTLLRTLENGTMVPATYLDFTPPVQNSTLHFSYAQATEEFVVSVQIHLDGVLVLSWMFNDGTAEMHHPFNETNDVWMPDIPSKTFMVVMKAPTAHYEGNYTVVVSSEATGGGLQKQLDIATSDVAVVNAIRYCTAVSNGKPLVDKKDNCKVTVTPSSGCPDGFVYGGNVQATARVLDKDSKETDALAFEMTDPQWDGSSRFVLGSAGAFAKTLTKGVQMKYEFTYQQGEHEKTTHTENIKCGAGSLSVSLGFLMGMLAILKSVV